jgi:hypothetical protein
MKTSKAKGIFKKIISDIKSPNINVQFIKNDYRKEKTHRKEILKRLLKNSDLSEEVEMTNEDIVLSLYNINETSKLNEKMPKVKSSLFKEMLSQFLMDNKRKVDKTDLKNLSYTQEKIYKILFKIEESLIDEQDTSIKEKEKQKDSEDAFFGRLEELLKKYCGDPAENKESESSFLSSLGLGALILTPFKYIYNKVKGTISTTLKAIGKGLSKIEGKLLKAFPKLAPAITGVKNAFTKIKTTISKSTSVASKFLTSAKGVALKSVKFLGKFVFKFADIALLGYKIVCFWKESQKFIKEPGCIEKLLFSVFSGITEWVKDHIDILSVLGKFIRWVMDFTKASIDTIVDYVSDFDKETTHFLKATLKTIIDVSPLSAIEKFIIRPLVEWLRKNGAYGADCGVLAVQIYREFKDSFISNIPNQTTLKLLLGDDEDLKNIQKKGLYTWNKLGDSTINVDAKTLAKLSSIEELRKMQEHGDLSSFDAQKVRKAIKLKESGEEEYNNEKNIKGDVNLIKLSEEISEKRAIGNNGFLNFQSEWHKFIKNSILIATTEPTACMVEYHVDENGDIGTFTPRSSLGYSETGLFSRVYDIPKRMIDYVLKYLKYKNINFKLNKPTDCIFFTAYGTLFIRSEEYDILKREELLKNAKKRLPNAHVYYKIIGHIKPSGEFKLKEIAKGDRCVEEYCLLNIITETDVKEKHAEAKSSNLTEVAKIPTEQPSDLPLAKPIQEQHSKSSINFGNSSALPSNQTSFNVSKSEIKQKTWSFLKGMGLSDEQTAGIMGNLEVESGGFGKAIFRVHNDRNGPSGGLCQWHDEESSLGKGRLSALLKFAGWTSEEIKKYFDQLRRNNWEGDLPISLETQLAFLRHELETTHKKALEGVLVSKSVHDSAKEWVYKFEKPRNKKEESIKRGNIGQSYLNSFKTSQKGDLKSAADFARNHAPGTKGACARYVANAFESIGLNFQRQSSAYMYHSNGVLKDMGFGVVSQGQSGYTAQKGDICVINKFGSHKHGHICIFDGQNWVSDFVQKNASPYKDYPGENNIFFYRYGSSGISVSQDVSVENYGSNEVYRPNSPINTQSDENGNVYVNNIQNTEEPIEYEGQSENLFNFKYNDILV